MVEYTHNTQKKPGLTTPKNMSMEHGGDDAHPIDQRQH